MIGAFIQVNTDSHMARTRPIGYLICENGCWEWVGYANDDGYGKFAAKGCSAHTWMWEQKNGPVPEGLELDHFYCDNRICVNPDHMRPVTHRENSLRSDNICAKSAAKTHCIRGHPLSGDNLVPNYLRHGARVCRICHRMHQRDFHRRHGGRSGQPRRP